LGSLRFAAALLVLLLVALSLATIFETTHGTEQALRRYYYAWWFKLLLGLVGLNVLSAVILRFPFTRRQIGFVLTHAGILVTLIGAVVSEQFGVSGQVGIADGQTASEFNLAGREAVTVLCGADQQTTTLSLAERIGDPLHPTEFGPPLELSVGKLKLSVLRYLPDSDWEQQVTDDNPAPQLGVEVALSADGHDESVWVLAGHSAFLGELEVAVREVADQAELDQILAGPATSAPTSKGQVHVEYQGASFEFSVEEGLAHVVPLGETGLTARLLRYLPHATVGQNREIVNASDRPMNPYVEVELTGPSGPETRRAFARFPDFAASHAGMSEEGAKVRFVAGDAPVTTAPIEVLSGPEGALHVRFSPVGGEPAVRRVSLGTAVDSPWRNHPFEVRRRFARARVQWQLAPVQPVRAQRMPGLLVRASTPVQTNEMWLQKGRGQRLMVDGVAHQVAYADETRPLGFALKLERFQIVPYPGEQRPRSFESHVNVTDPTTGQTRSAVISMNAPLSFGGYTLYQSSYRQEGGQSVSFLSVSRDWGQPIAFAGYGALMAGMVIVLVTRMLERRRPAGAST
jgi:hypothetical protein